MLMKVYCECGIFQGYEDVQNMPTTKLCTMCKTKKNAEAIRLANIFALNKVQDAMAMEKMT